jgi:hypothetical protein
MAEGFSNPVQTSCQNRRKRISKWVPITLMWTSWPRVCQLRFMLITLSTFSCKQWTWWFSLMCTITIGKTPQNCRSCKTNSVPSNRHRPHKLSIQPFYQVTCIYPAQHNQQIRNQSFNCWRKSHTICIDASEKILM